MRKIAAPTLLGRIIPFILLLLGLNTYADTRALPESTVQFGKARFTLLTPELIRLEYSDQERFEDRASLTVIQRQLPAVQFSKKINGNILTLTTTNVRLTFTNDEKPFHEKNLVIELIADNKKTTQWIPNQIDNENLKGTLRTLDQANGWNFEQKLEKGILSRQGWALIDDSESLLFDGDKEWNWVTPRTTKNLDWYFFGYGNNYKKALYDFTQIAGKIPMPPKYAFGYWWSRYWIYNDNEVRELVSQLRGFNIPLDVFILDMDWHETYDFSGKNPERDSQGEMKGWTGYTWNKQLFPEPQQLIQWTNDQHLKVALNLHPASGVPTMEEKYAEFVKAYGAPNNNEYVPFNISDKKWASTYFNTMLKPMQEWGVDFWWLDWQQFLQDKHIPNLSVTWWLNYTFFTNMEKSGKRPMIFHRWGGIGNHRYPIGFSGDTHTNWETLDFETYFTATAANVGYGYWSHDIGGHMSDGKPTDGELYLRWIQFGAFSPILRTHASKISTIERRPWMFPNEFFAMRDAIRLRYTLAPYIYAAARKTYDTGIAMAHPLYYDYPNQPQAYTYKTEYFFGDAIIVAPIAKPVNKVTQLADKKIWLPKGEWFEYSSGDLLKGNQEVVRHYALDEIPLFFKGGSIIPLSPDIQHLQQKIDKTTLAFIPGGGGGSIELYDDDETTNAYQHNHFSTRKVTQFELTSRSLKIIIDPVQGYFDGMSSDHTFDLQFPNRILPSAVKINGANRNLPMEFLPKDLTSLIHLPQLPTRERIEIVVEFSQTFAVQNKFFDCNKGFLHRINRVTEKMKYLAAQTDWGGTLPNDIYRAGNILNQLQYHPENAVPLMRELRQLRKNFPAMVSRVRNLPPESAKPLLDFLDFHELE